MIVRNPTPADWAQCGYLDGGASCVTTDLAAVVAVWVVFGVVVFAVWLFGATRK